MGLVSLTKRRLTSNLIPSYNYFNRRFKVTELISSPQKQKEKQGAAAITFKLKVQVGHKEQHFQESSTVLKGLLESRGTVESPSSN